MNTLLSISQSPPGTGWHNLHPGLCAPFFRCVTLLGLDCQADGRLRAAQAHVSLDPGLRSKTCFLFKKLHNFFLLFEVGFGEGILAVHTEGFRNILQLVLCLSSWEGKAKGDCPVTQAGIDFRLFSKDINFGGFKDLEISFS